MWAPRKTSELTRILALPYRDPKGLGESLVLDWTEALRAEKGVMELHPHQALALYESAMLGGSVVLLPVGQGKTLISFLLPIVLESKKPLLIVPAKLVEKTKIEFEELKKHWNYPTPIEIVSYELISTRAGMLDELAPDLIIADEVHKIKNPHAACTKRVFGYYRENFPKFVGLSGTITKRSFVDWWHLQLMALPDGFHPLPLDRNENAVWSESLDEKVKVRRPLGALSCFGPDLSSARVGYGEKLKGCSGVITTQDRGVDASLQIEVFDLENSLLKQAISNLQDAWVLPDGTEIIEAVDVWRHSREMANGFYYRWIEPGPPHWMSARSTFNEFVLRKLKYSIKYTAPKEVIEAYQYEPQIEQWKAIKPTFTPKTEAVWLDLGTVSDVLEKIINEGGLLWFEHRAVADELVKRGCPVFIEKGEEVNTKQSIAQYEGDFAAVSVSAVSEGYNLQRWDHNLVLNCTPSGTRWEQLIGRTHRQGQKSDSVTVDVISVGGVQRRDFKQARRDAQYIQEITGQNQKLAYADIIGGNGF